MTPPFDPPSDPAFDPAAFVPVAETVRSGHAESVHHGAVVALDRHGDVAWAAGDPDVCIYARSSLKPLQAAAMMTAGLALADRLLAVACGSHDGRPEHLEAVRAILVAAGLDERDLENTPGLPLDHDAMTLAVQAGAAPTALQQNCSGKHAAMLATAVVNGWPTAGYVAPDHPVQQLITAHIASVAGRVAHVGVDGCGAPAQVVALSGLARAVRDLAVAGHPVHHAMTAHPELVGGPQRDVTVLMRAVPGLLAKEGAEGVHVAALADGRAVAVKIADGANRARATVMAAGLRSLGVDVASDLIVEPVLGHGRPVGEVRALIGTP